MSGVARGCQSAACAHSWPSVMAFIARVTPSLVSDPPLECSSNSLPLPRGWVGGWSCACSPKAWETVLSVSSYSLVAE